MVAERAGIDTWSPAWYVDPDGPTLRHLRELASERASMGARLLPDTIAGHRVGVFRSGLVFAEGHPGGERLGRAEELPAAYDGLEAVLADYGLPMPARRPLGALTLDAAPRPGRAGVRRLDLTCDLRFDRPDEGLAVLAGVAGLPFGRVKKNVWCEAGGSRIETVSLHGYRGGKKLARWYDKGVEAGTAPRGTLIRSEDQRLFGRDNRRDVEELDATYCRNLFARRFLPLWEASKGVTVGSPLVLGQKLHALVLDGELAPSRARSLAGHLLLEAAGDGNQGARRTRLQLRAECRRHGLVLAVGNEEEVEVYLADVMEAALTAESWGADG